MAPHSPASCGIKGMTVEPVKSSIDRRLVRAGKLPMSIKQGERKTSKTKKHKTKENYANNGLYRNKKRMCGKKERWRKKILLMYEGMHIGMM